jgi:oligoendopeptidase F
MTQDTTNKAYEEAFTYFCMELEPRIKQAAFDLNRKLLDCPWRAELDPNLYFPYLRSVENAVALYRDENVGLQAEANLLAQQYGMTTGAMTVDVDGKEYTLQQAVKFLQGADRQQREMVYRKVAARRLQDKATLDELFDKLLALRHRIALNAGFDNYRDYKFRELGRFDYTVEDCFRFQEAVKEYILPIQARFVAHRKKKLGLDVMKPWDSEAVPKGTQPLHPFQTGEELCEKSIEVFSKLDPYFSGCLDYMRQIGRLDLESRKGGDMDEWPADLRVREFPQGKEAP